MSFIRDAATVGTGNTYNVLGDSRGVPTQMRYGKETELAAGVEVRDGNADTLSLVVEGKQGVTILLENTHDVAFDVEIYIKPTAASSSRLLLYSADDVLLATTGVLIFGAAAGGTGADSTYLVIAALANVPTYQIDVVLTPASAPASGDYSAYAYAS